MIRSKPESRLGRVSNPESPMAQTTPSHSVASSRRKRAVMLLAIAVFVQPDHSAAGYKSTGNRFLRAVPADFAAVHCIDLRAGA